MRDKQRNTVEIPQYLDFNKLRELGLEYLKSVTGNVWTDFGLHDPGVTTLELLCYALMDLGFRTSFDIKDILTPEGSSVPVLDGTMYQAHEILPCSPVTVADYRKLILQNVPGVRNVWLEPSTKTVRTKGVEGLTDTEIAVNGFYKLTVDLESEDELKKHDYYRQVVGRDSKGRYISGFEGKYKDAYKDYIINLFHKHRNLCENIDSGSFGITEHIDVGICAEIEIARESDCGKILNMINEKLTEYVRPSIRLHTLDQMLSKGKTPDEIYQGALPKFGFIDSDELEAFSRRRTLYVSDALNLIMSVPGVRSVSHLHFHVDHDKLGLVNASTSFKLELNRASSEDEKEYSFVFKSWPILVGRDAPGARRLGSAGMFDGLSEVTFTINGIPFSAGTDIPLYTADGVRGVLLTERDEAVGFSPVLPVPEGTHCFTERYYSIQNLFPGIYMLGQSGVPEESTALRKAERHQFKAYLLFFERLLADYLVQLSSLPELFSWATGTGSGDLTYFSSVLTGEEIKDLSEVLKDSHCQVHDQDASLERRNRFLDHMLARFNEKFVDYTILNYLNPSVNGSGDFNLRQAIHDKKAFLKNYIEFRGMKACSADLTEKWTYSLMERRIMSRLGIDNPPGLLAPSSVMGEDGILEFEDNTAESYNTAFGIHILEHNLLASKADLDDSTFYKLTGGLDIEKFVKDPYSMQVTAIVPGWLDICQKEYFRILVENVIREEVPAHVSLKVCWVDPYVMMRFEDVFKRFCDNISGEIFALGEPSEEPDCLSELISVLGTVHNIYPPTTIGKSRVHPVARLDYSVLGKKNTIREGDNWRIGKLTKN